MLLISLTVFSILPDLMSHLNLLGFVAAYLFDEAVAIATACFDVSSGDSLVVS